MKIHDHLILKIPPDTKIQDMHLAWVRGYILALEDILGDLAKEFEYQPTGGSTSQLDYRAGHELAVIRIRMEVTETWTQARATLTTLERMEDEQLEAVQRDPGAGGAGSPPTAPDPEDQGRVPH